MSDDNGPGSGLSELRAAWLAKILCRYFGDLDDATIADIEQRLAWFEAASGERLIEQGDPGDGVFFVLSGRLRATATDAAGATRIIGEISEGESVGELALLTKEPRSATVAAVRDSVLVGLSCRDFDELSLRHPEMVAGLAALVVARERTRRIAPTAGTNVANIAVVALDRTAELNEFCERLGAALERDAGESVRHVHRQLVDAQLAQPGIADAAPGDPDHGLLSDWLSRQEHHAGFMIYQADGDLTEWSQRCVRQADVVLLVAGASSDPAVESIEDALLGASGLAPETHRVLALVHEPGTRPAGTAPWLANRPAADWVHLEAGSADGFGRLARMLAGRSIGLAFGGGGARGFVHLGTVKALGEAGIPIDLIAGTSIGSIFAALVATGLEYSVIEDMARTAFVKKRPLGDYTLPLVAIYKGKRIDRLLTDTFGVGRLEDLPLRCHVVASNLSTAEPIVLDRGPIRHALRASFALPGVLPPVVHGNHLLIDGGMFDVLPIDVVRTAGAGTVVAVDLTVRKEYQLDYDRVPSAWKLLAQRVVPGMKRTRVPGITGIMMKATALASMEKAGRDREASDLYLNPPVGKVGFLDLKAFDRVVELGYRHAAEQIEAWRNGSNRPAGSR
jgi:predicted acylesterase/phospholipase RssA/CRP-like cAMP-binding protein